MIKVIDLRSEYSTNPIFVNFNRQAYAIPTLYAKSLPKFESKQISTCLIILYPHDDFPEKPNIKGFADFYISLWKGLLNGKYPVNFLRLTQSMILRKK